MFDRFVVIFFFIETIELRRCFVNVGTLCRDPTRLRATAHCSERGAHHESNCQHVNMRPDSGHQTTINIVIVINNRAFNSTQNKPMSPFFFFFNI